MKILNLYSGIGGNRKLWGDEHKITAIENNQEIAEIYKDIFPNDIMIVGDAHKYLLENYMNYDFIWSSPPCPSHSDIRRCGVHRGLFKAIYPEMSLYQEILLLKHYAKRETKFVVENVKPYYKPLITPDKILHRHCFWANFAIQDFIKIKNKVAHDRMKATTKLYDYDITGTSIKNKVKALRNMVDPELGLHILNCATKSYYKQKVETIDIFDNE